MELEKSKKKLWIKLIILQIWKSTKQVKTNKPLDYEKS